MSPITLSAPEIGISHLPNQRHKISTNKGADFSIMVCGESGVGKTTFINTFFETMVKEPKDEDNRYTKPSTKTTEIQVTRAEIEEQQFKVNLRIIDTPGYGDYINSCNSWTPIVDYIDEQYEAFLRQEQQPDRKEIQDKRVHVCLYFIRPTGGRLKPLDIETMKRLGSRVNLVPVISKADTLSSRELAAFKERVRADMDANYIHIYQCPIESEDEQVTRANKEMMVAIPFSLIGSTQKVQTPDGRTVRGRAYHWGVVEVENEAHCDFKKLRRLLIRSHMSDLIDTTEYVHYENYRLNEMGSRKFGEPKASTYRSPELVEKEESIRKELTEKVKKQETRFRLWESKLVIERDRLNADLEARHAQIKMLETEIEGMCYRKKCRG